MQSHYIDPIKKHPSFIKLQKERRKLALILSSLVLLIYFSFILSIAFAPQLLSAPVASGSVITVGIPIGIAIILLSFILTGIYVYIANKQFDRYTQEIHADVVEL